MFAHLSSPANMSLMFVCLVFWLVACVSPFVCLLTKQAWAVLCGCICPLAPNAVLFDANRDATEMSRSLRNAIDGVQSITKNVHSQLHEISHLAGAKIDVWMPVFCSMFAF